METIRDIDQYAQERYFGLPGRTLGYTAIILVQYLSCHFFLDYYLSDTDEKFCPPAPFGLSEFDPSGTYPDRTYSKNELLEYIDHCRVKCHALINNLTTEKAEKRFINDYGNYSTLEISLYNMRHVQHQKKTLEKLEDSTPT